jgi:RepB DNA-primase from phage plasmid
VQTQSPGSGSVGNILTPAWCQGNSQELEPNLPPDEHAERIVDLWVHLFEGLEGYLVTFTGQQSARADARPNELDATQQISWRWPTQAEDAADYLLEQSRTGRDAFFGVHLLRHSGNRKAENAAEILALWVDGDGARVPEDWPQPTAVVESSPGRHHFYWRLTRPTDPEYAARLNKRLCYGIGGDKGKWGLGTVLRAPGTLNYKRERPTLVAGGVGA